MKIIDFDKKGNVVRFYFGDDSLTDYWGDDWNDRPYECNAGTVYEEFIKGYVDIAFDFDSLVLEPENDWRNHGNSQWCKDDMRERKVPCIIVVPKELLEDTWEDGFNYWVAADRVEKIYFNDPITILKHMGEWSKVVTL